MLFFVSFKFLFSWKGIYTIAIASFLVWIFKDYPHWKSQHERSDAIKKLGKNENVGFKHSVTAAKQSSRTQTDGAGAAANRKNPSKGDEKLSIIHYVLVSPFAALYIIVRAVIDTIKYSLYFFLWWCEKALPYLDDWLFAFVTITIPKAYEQTEQWWLQRGKPAYLKRKAYIKQVIFPSIIDKLEKFFLSLYKASCVAQNGIKEFVAALNKFIKRHDWQQLMEDLGNIVYDRFWIPSTLVLTRAINLYKFIYAGIRATVISIVNEAKWICTVAIPTAYQYIVSTRLAKAVYNGSVWIKEKLQLLFTLLNTYILAPTVGRLLTGIVKAIDKLILLLQQRTFQKKLAKLYRIYGPKLVWVTVEISGILFDSMALVRHFWAELLYPAYRLFVKHVKPRLSIAYKSFATCIDHWLRSKVFPAWIRLYPYLNIPLFWVYMNLALPLYCEIYTIQSTAAACISQNLAGKIWSVMSTIIELVAVYAKEVYTLLQLWLMKQAPVLSRILQKSYETIRSSCNWTSLQQDILYTASQFYDWMAKQINNIYLSMERSLNSWVEEQQEEIGDISLEKRKEVGSNESYSVEPNHG